MHIADPTIGIFGANGIVARGPADRGRARRPRRSCARDGTVAVAFFGDGAVAQGTFHEAVNLAAVWRLPVVFFCENNGYAEFSPASTQHAASLEQRAAGYGVDYVAVDGNDVVATATAMHDVVAATRAGRGPVIVEAATYRWHGHYEGDPQRYRSPEEVRGVGSARPAARPRAPAPVGGHRRRHARRRWSRRSRTSSTTPSRRPGGSTPPASATLTDFVTRPRPERARAAGPRRRCPGVPHHGRDPRRARSRARRRRARVRRGHRRRAPAATSSG